MNHERNIGKRCFCIQGPSMITGIVVAVVPAKTGSLKKAVKANFSDEESGRYSPRWLFDKCRWDRYLIRRDKPTKDGRMFTSARAQNVHFSEAPKTCAHNPVPAPRVPRGLGRPLVPRPEDRMERVGAFVEPQNLPGGGWERVTKRRSV